MKEKYFVTQQFGKDLDGAGYAITSETWDD